MAVSGTRTAYTARQDHASISTPPKAGPAITERPLQAVQLPIARDRSAPEKVVVIMASALGTITAAAAP